MGPLYEDLRDLRATDAVTAAAEGEVYTFSLCGDHLLSH